MDAYNIMAVFDVRQMLTNGAGINTNWAISMHRLVRSAYGGRGKIFSDMVVDFGN